eukprot:TRINITY_DN38361_c3_g1_i1.p1 TRINITY_DN38361_c3_g1~~TRINITY_DN38361_c3_g1_i1.p1  ORF type:complete len:464 (+),score=51.27 TRINITY_DN38361_c3_g1_i1:116-1507(+)
MKGASQHVAMLPWLAFGHLIPFLQLSISLAKAGFRISFLSTPKNIQRLPKLPQDLTSHITFVELPLPRVDGLDQAAEATVDLPTLADDLLKKAYDLLLPHFHHFVARESPDFIVHDLITHWTAEIARQFGVPRVLFSIYSAAPIAFVGLGESLSVDQLRKHWPTPESLTSPPPWIPFRSTVAFLPHEGEMMHGMFTTDASGISVAQRVVSAVDGCEAMVLRSCAEYEGEYLDVLKKYPKPVIPIGLLQPEKCETDPTAGDWGSIFRWLDGKAPRSVVFVVFGSECKLRKNEVYEIAHGLELSELDFLWALRRPEWAMDDSEALPTGFEARIKGRGIVHLGWAPQLEILAHQAIGGSMFHAGWGTIIETVQYGHPLVVLPFANVQGLDARLAVEKGLAVEVEREKDGKFHREAIAKALRRAVIEDEGEGLRLRSREMMAIFSDRGLHERYLSKFVEFLKGYRTK